MPRGRRKYPRLIASGNTTFLVMYGPMLLLMGTKCNDSILEVLYRALQEKVTIWEVLRRPRVMPRFLRFLGQCHTWWKGL